MNVSDFDFELPPELIANYPAKERTRSRLLVVDGSEGSLSDLHFSDVVDLIEPSDLLIFNDTKVVPARLYGHKASGGKLEVLFERVVDTHTFLAHIRSSRSPKPGSVIMVGTDKVGTDKVGTDIGGNDSDLAVVELEVLGRDGALFILKSRGAEVFELLETFGHIPLPPYIDRSDEHEDHERYQTVYADKPGAAAAPTAGLHFDQSLIDTLKQKGVRTAFVTLHVGAGTFQPVKVDKVEDHEMHSEWIEVKQDVVDLVKGTQARGGRVICVGTTSVRCIETASQSGELVPYVGDTRIFIYPGYTYRTVNALITNFHLPKSTLLMLVSAFSGKENTLRAYHHAIKQKYRFFSYGDAMFLNPGSKKLSVNNV